MLAAIRCFSAGQDAVLVLGGLITILGATPPSLTQLGVYGFASTLWSLALLLGGALAFVGVVREHYDVQMYGCFIVAAGFTVWALAATVQTDATSTSYTVACILVAGALGEIIWGLSVLAYSRGLIR